MKKLLIVLIILILVLGLGNAAPLGLLFNSTVTPVCVGNSNEPITRTGEATAMSLFNLFGFGDGGINAASKAGGLSSINYIDKNTVVILYGLLAFETTRVYGQ